METTRRVALAFGALVLTGALLRGPLSDALVSRGDEFLRGGDPRIGRVYYLRALFLNPDSAAAVDRLAFGDLELRTPASLREATTVSAGFLSRHPDEWSVRLDRALALHAERRDAAAALEFMRIAEQRRAFPYFGLAGHAALRAGDKTMARRAFAEALRIQPGYAAARRILGRLH